MKMKILGISGSPRKNGNTDILIKRALDLCKKNGAEIEFLSLSDSRLEYCDACYSCKMGSCIKKDDVQKILNSMTKSDAIIIGSPTYFSSISGRLKTLFDRSLPLRIHGYKLRDKVGGAIAVGGSRNGGQEFVIRDIHNWMLLHEMIVVSDRKTAHFGGIAVGRNPGDVLKDETGLKTVDNLAIHIVEITERLLKC